MACGPYFSLVYIPGPQRGEAAWWEHALQQVANEKETSRLSRYETQLGRGETYRIPETTKEGSNPSLAILQLHRRSAVDNETAKRMRSILAGCEAIKTYVTGATPPSPGESLPLDAQQIMNRHCMWVEQRVVANSVSGQFDAAQMMRETLQRGLEILEGVGIRPR